MSFKHLMMSVCMGVVLSSVICSPVKARHVTNDPAANVMDAAILVQDIMAVVLKASDLAEFVKRNLSFGELQAFKNKLDFTKKAKDLVNQVSVDNIDFGNLSSLSTKAQTTVNAAGEKVTEVASDFSGKFAAATKDASQMKELIGDILPSADDLQLTTKEKADRKNAREAIRKDAISKAYATAVAYQNKMTAAAEELIKPVQDIAGGAETQQEKQAAANEVGLARLNTLIENNMLQASMLQLQAAEAMANVPVDL